MAVTTAMEHSRSIFSYHIDLVRLLPNAEWALSLLGSKWALEQFHGYLFSF